jgi:hypothetical protein
MERTFIRRDKQLFVFATGGGKHFDVSESVQQNTGNGIRYSLSGDLIDNMVKVSNNKAIYNSEDKVKKYVINKRPNQKENVKSITTHFTDNPWAELSEAAVGLGTNITVKWDNSNPEILYPGMPVTYLYKSNGKLTTLVGVLIGTNRITKPATESILDDHYVVSVMLTVHVIKTDEETGVV